jgi:hypothetical protein
MISLHECRARHSLDGAWRYMLEGEEPGEPLGYTRRDHDDGAWREMELPTNWYLTEVGDVFGTIWFRKAFRVPEALRARRLFLRFGAVDYLADVWLNGTYLGHHEGMFNPFEFDVSGRLDLEGENVVVVKDAAPRDDTEYVPVGSRDNPLSAPYRTHQARAINRIKGHMIDAMHRPGSMTSFRSDGNSGRIWDAVELIARAGRVRRPRPGLEQDRQTEGLGGRRQGQARRDRPRERGRDRAQHHGRGRLDRARAGHPAVERRRRRGARAHTGARRRLAAAASRVRPRRIAA